jgi:hypothetical protein
MTERPPVIAIVSPTAEARKLWSLALSLSEAFGARRDWALVGGLMVQLHGFEHDDDPRPTTDIDMLGGARRSPRMTETMAAFLVDEGAQIPTPPRSNPDLGYVFEL